MPLRAKWAATEPMAKKPSQGGSAPSNVGQTPFPYAPIPYPGGLGQQEEKPELKKTGPSGTQYKPGTVKGTGGKK